MNLTKKFIAQVRLAASAGVVGAMVLVFPLAVNASDLDGGDLFGGFGGWDTYSFDGGWDNYGSGWDNYSSDWDTYNYGSGWDNYSSDWDTYNYGSGWDNYSSDWDTYNYGSGWDNYSSSGGFVDADGRFYDDVSGTWYDDASGRFYDDVSGTWYDDATGRYYTTGGGGSSKSSGCATCGYSTPSYRPISYSSSIPGWIGWSGSSYVPPKTPTYPTYPTPTKPVVTGGGSISNTTITNVDNSIRDSFNNYNSGNTTIVGTPIAQTPIYTPPMQNFYCVISATPNTVQNGSYATLSWTSSGATSAWLSDGLGSVAVNGSKMVIPDTSRTYTLTVYGSQGTQSCSTYVNVSGSYVALTQIPYTGFDLGPMGNTLYWAGLAAFALGGAYLMTYMVPGMSLAFAGTASQRTYQPVVAPKAPLLIEREAAAEKLAPIVQSLRAQVTTDTMAIVQKEGSMPKIVIARS